MDGFTYTNIFETKGIEYLVIIAFLILIIPFWIILNKRPKIAIQIRKTWEVLTAALLKIPEGLFFSKNHTWAYLEKSGEANVGLDDFLLKTIGDVKIRNLINPGEIIRKGDTIAEVKQNDKTLKVISPLSGEIIQMNSTLAENPEILNEDPYEEGWFYKIKPSDWIAETKSYYLGEKAKIWTTKELDRLKDFIATSVGKHSPEHSLVVLQEGGELRANPLSELKNEIWEDFQKEFLNQT